MSNVEIPKSCGECTEHGPEGTEGHQGQAVCNPTGFAVNLEGDQPLANCLYLNSIKKEKPVEE